MKASVVQPSATALSRLAPLGAADVAILDGFWSQRLRINRERTIPHGFDQLKRAGNLDNLRLAAGVKGQYHGGSDTSGFAFPFLDSDVYKWLEAVGWELGRGASPALEAAAGEAVSVLVAAQRADGYLNSYVEVVGGGQPYRDLAWGHEFYCIAHLVQAAIAWHRALGDDRLLTIAVQAVESIEREFGPSGRPGIDGHPGIEMALAELFRITHDQRHLALAARMIELRGRGLLGAGRFGATYWQDHEPVRDAPTVAGHVVRQLYLDCGAVDVAVERGDVELLDAVQRRWRDLVETRSYLTGGAGSRYRDEAFGDPFELPPDQAYTETCAAIASVMLAWRLLLATGDPSYADAAERIIYNGILSGVSLTGTQFFYVNPLQRRTHRAAEAPGHGERAPWFPCACCPPNLMRLFSSWQQYLATRDDEGVQLHQYAAAEIQADILGGVVRLSIETDYPWDSRIVVRIEESPDDPWTLSLRVPRWCRSAVLTEPGEGDPQEPGGQTSLPEGTRTVARRRVWRSGDSIVLALDMPIRVTEPDPRIDAVRGCVAIERGPLVYCIETVDLPPGAELEGLEWDPARRPTPVPRPDLGDQFVGIEVPVVGREPTAGRLQELIAGAVPYFVWANRRVAGMRVWIPAARWTGARSAPA